LFLSPSGENSPQKKPWSKHLKSGYQRKTNKKMSQPGASKVN
jgi:hypothetical protein